MRITVRLTPNAARDEIGGRMESGAFRIRVQSPPVEGKANHRLLRFLSKRLGVAKSAVRIVSGEKSRDKIVEIDGDEPVILGRLIDEGKNT